MKIVDRENLDVARWDWFVHDYPEASFFSCSWYLDAVAENWCVIVNDDYTAGMALPYTVRMGTKILYVPIFSRYVTPIGDFTEDDINLIKKQFSVREIATSSKLFDDYSGRIHQVIEPEEERTLSSQGKRSIKKSLKNLVRVEMTKDYSNVLSAIKEELKGKFQGVDETSVARLEKLLAAAAEHKVLQVVEVSADGEKGGVCCLMNKHSVLYVKGACPESLKNKGGMYLALDMAIGLAMATNLPFDFGGSNVEGVRRFNMNLGGKDKSYYFHECNEGPLLFKIARKLKRRRK